jgi:hypothetical protein
MGSDAKNMLLDRREGVLGKDHSFASQPRAGMKRNRTCGLFTERTRREADHLVAKNAAFNGQPSHARDDLLPMIAILGQDLEAHARMRPMFLRAPQQNRHRHASVDAQVQARLNTQPSRSGAIRKRGVVDRPEPDPALLRALHQLGERHEPMLIAQQTHQLMRAAALLQPRIDADLEVDVLKRREVISHDRKPLRIPPQVRLQRGSHRITINRTPELVHHY